MNSTKRRQYRVLDLLLSDDAEYEIEIGKIYRCKEQTNDVAVKSLGMFVHNKDGWAKIPPGVLVLVLGIKTHYFQGPLEWNKVECQSIMTHFLYDGVEYVLGPDYFLDNFELEEHEQRNERISEG